MTAWRSLLSVSDSVRGSRGCGLGHAASSESLAKNSDGGEASIGLQGESESWEGSLWERGRHRRARWGPWLDTHGLLPECGPGLTARAPRGGGKGARDLLPLGAPRAAPWLLLPLSPPPTPLLSSPGGINHGAGEMEQQPAAGLALGCPPPPPRTPTLSAPGLWDGRLRPACQDGGLSKKQQINCQRHWGPSVTTLPHWPPRTRLASASPKENPRFSSFESCLESETPTPPCSAFSAQTPGRALMRLETWWHCYF